MSLGCPTLLQQPSWAAISRTSCRHTGRATTSSSFHSSMLYFVPVKCLEKTSHCTCPEYTWVVQDPCKKRCELQNQMAAPDRGTVPISYCLYAGLPQLSLPSLLTGAQRGNLPSEEEVIMTVPAITRSKPTWLTAGRRAPAGQQPPSRRSPPAAAPPPAPAHGPDPGLGAGEAASPSKPPALSVPGAWRSPARPAEQVGTGRAGERQGLGAGAEPRAAWGSEALQGPGRGR